MRDSAKVDVFLSVVGPKTYKLLKSLIAPMLPSDKTIDELYQTLKRHVQPTDSVISRRARFYTRNQKDTESVTDFVAELKLLAAECEFDAFLDQALRYIFAIGIGDRETQRKLRSEAIDFRQGGRDRSRVRTNFAGIKRYFRQRRSGWHACIRSLQ